jgi:hypothetical protein
MNGETRPSRDYRQFLGNGWLTLKSGHSEAARQAPKLNSGVNFLNI